MMLSLDILIILGIELKDICENFVVFILNFK